MPLKLSEEDQKELKKLLARWKADPIAFVLEAFGPGYRAATGQTLVIDRWQRKFLCALVAHKPGSCGRAICNGRAHRRVAAKACKGPGKTAVLAWVGWWRLLIAGSNHRGAAISITGGNLKSGLWPELALWQTYSPLLVQEFEHKAEAITSRDFPKTCWLQARAFQAEAGSEKQAESLAGLHAENTTVLLDEVGSFPQGVVDAANAVFNTKGQDVLICAAGNATDVDGALHTICTRDASAWYVVEITGDPDDPDRSPRIDIEEARRQIAERGRGDPVVMVNILGQFPPKGGSKLLGSNDVSDAMKRNCNRRAYEYQPLVWGIDVAGEGLDPDEATLYGRKGPVVTKPQAWHNLPVDELTRRIALKYFDAKRVGKAPKRIFVDRGGIGQGLVSLLKTLLGADSDKVIGVDFGGTANREELYADRRTEMYCEGAMWLRREGCLPDVPELRRDLTAPNIGTESLTKWGTRRKLESKRDMKKRGLPSPDHGDGFVLTFAFPVLPDDPDAALGIPQAAQTDFNPFAHLGGRR